MESNRSIVYFVNMYTVYYHIVHAQNKYFDRELSYIFDCSYYQ